ncbi:uncharacterized protein LOC100378260 [Saccoglossus kowalevskii]|uniref:Uncharacterized protein LOC100378260 n=1 Tax=Saccoglossus kowalevskii TaxID=10224 RepID=A0ABM0GLU6_SACKO|nr:PREDICTED: uncharacterized protein LOC100378260 [Saccoglossus kowalevskii]
MSRIYARFLCLLIIFSIGSYISALVDGEDESQCLVHNSPALDAKYCTDQLRSFETRLTRILDKIEEKTEKFDFQQGCRPGWYGFRDHCYYFSREKQTWNDARYWCETQGHSDLLSITGEAERDFVVDKLKYHEVDDDGAVHFWIGLNDIDVEGQYKWSSGVPVKTTYWKSNMLHTFTHTTTNKYVLNASSNVTVLQTLPDMHAITTCFWMKSSATNTGTPVSYAVESQKNEFLVFNYNSVKPHVTGNAVQSTVDLSDGLWHHACVTWTSINGQWQVYKDGVLAAEGTGLSTSLYIHGGGVLILGQEQDSLGGGFDVTQAFVGELSLFNLWDRVLTSDEIGANFADCIGAGNVYSWDSNAISAVSMTIAPFQSVCSKDVTHNKYVLNVSSNVTVLQTLPDMYAITTCFWVKSSATNEGTPVSYSIESQFNEFIIFNYNSVRPLVAGNYVQTAVDLSDGLWHHACVTWTSVNGHWQIYKDGILAADGTGLSTGSHIHGGGVLILGQEQDSLGGGFDVTQAFVGELSLFNLWDRVLTSDEIGANFADCIGAGNVYSWDSNAISAVSMTIVPFQSVCSKEFDDSLRQNCVEIMDIFGNWNDERCNNEYRFICKTHKVPRDCMGVINLGYNYSGVYRIDPDGHGSFDVYCDMETDGGGYTVFQRRTDGSVAFFRDWKDYTLGFGDLNDEFWLGNDKLNRLTRGRHQEIRIDLKNVIGVTDFAVYDYFSIGHENDFYRLRLGSKISGGLPDSLSHHLNMRFSTKDRDNTANNENCALNQHSGWWYNQCQYSDLNREYADDFGISWYDWSNPRIIESEMKIR